MEKYEQIATVGEGSYGVVMKCRHRGTGQLVAVKKFLETEEDATIRKMAIREIRMLKKIHHENIVNIIEVFRRRRRMYMVFEFVERTVLQELEDAPGGLPEHQVRQISFQLLRALAHCHANNIIHRDVKPENVLLSRAGVVKLCDFGFARVAALPSEPYTDYVATRWYRAPELLVADPRYGPEVDVWAAGCMLGEMATGTPLFPGESDLDQLHLIIQLIGKLTPRQQELLARQKRSLARPPIGVAAAKPLGQRGAREALMAAMLRADPSRRPHCAQLLRHVYFTKDGFAAHFSIEIKRRAQQEALLNPLTAGPRAGAQSQARAPPLAPPSSPAPPLLALPLLSTSGTGRSSFSNYGAEKSEELLECPPSTPTRLILPSIATPTPAARLPSKPSPNTKNSICRSTLQITFDAKPLRMAVMGRPKLLQHPLR